MLFLIRSLLYVRVSCLRRPVRRRRAVNSKLEPILQKCLHHTITLHFISSQPSE
jgi:hypothetical protein